MSENSGMDEEFGRYRLRGTLGTGGMGQVYRAYDTALGREVALKVLHARAATDPVFEERFRREARIAYLEELQQNKSQPNELKEKYPFIGEVRGKGLFLAMELVEDRNTKKPLSSEKCMKLFKKGVEKGFLSMSYAPAVRFQPALSITDEELNRGLELLEESLKEI